MSTPAFSTPLASPSDLFAQVYDRHWKRLYNLTFHHTRDEELAKEIVQLVFESLWKRWDTFTVEAWLEGYLLKAVKIQIAAHYRQQVSRQQHLDQIQQQRETLDHTTENQVLLNELTHRVRRAYP